MAPVQDILLKSVYAPESLPSNRIKGVCASSYRLQRVCICAFLELRR